MKKIVAITGTYSGKNYIIREFLESVFSLDTTGIDYTHYLIDTTTKGREYYQLLERLCEGKNIILSRKQYASNIRQKDRLRAMCDVMNFARSKVLAENADYLLLWESDTIVPDYTLKKLLSYGKSVTVPQIINSGNHEEELPFGSVQKLPFDHHYFGMKFNPFPQNGELKGLIEVDWAISVFVLIDQKTLRKVRFRFDMKKGNWGPDRFMSSDFHELGQKITLDTDIEALHYYESSDDD